MKKPKILGFLFMFVQLRNYFVLIRSDNTSEKRTTRASFAYTTLKTLDDVTYVLQAIIEVNFVGFRPVPIDNHARWIHAEFSLFDSAVRSSLKHK